MMNLWWCMDCLAPVELDTHGRCESCASEAVTPAGPGAGAPEAMLGGALPSVFPACRAEATA